MGQMPPIALNRCRLSLRASVSQRCFRCSLSLPSASVSLRFLNGGHTYPGWCLQAFGHKELGMNGFGERLKARARELGLSDAEIARRLNLSHGRYNHYANNVNEPDLATLKRIAAVLQTRPDDLLGVEQTPARGSKGDLRTRISLLAASMDLPTLKAAILLMETLIAGKIGARDIGTPKTD